MNDILDVIVKMRERKQPFALATVVETFGSVSAETGSKALIDKHGRIITGWVGGGCAESSACATALECLQANRTRVIDINMDDEVLGVGMPCGGSMRVYIEPMLPKPALWILGHGQIAECLGAIADLVGFEVIVDDPLAEIGHFSSASRLISDDTLEYHQLQPTREDFVVIATQHKGDHHSIRRALDSQAAYIAMIASHKRARLVLDYLRDAGYAPNQIQRVRSPAGLDLGAQTPGEIALSIASEMVMIRRGANAHAMQTLVDLDSAAVPG